MSNYSLDSNKARLWGTPTTCTILYRNNNWYASITVELTELQVAARQTDFGSAGIDFGCNAALVMLLWAQGILPASGTGVVGDDAPSSTSCTRKRKQAGSMKQLGQLKRQKSRCAESGLETQTSA